MGRKSRPFAHLHSSLDARFAELEVEIGESLRPRARIFPFCGDYRRRQVRSRLPPEGGIRFCALIRFRANTYQPERKISVWSVTGLRFVRMRNPVIRAASSSVEAIEAVLDGGAVRVPDGAVGVLEVQQRVNDVQVGGAERQFTDRLVEPDSCLMLDARL
jgi:hypothetical protein